VRFCLQYSKSLSESQRKNEKLFRQPPKKLPDPGEKTADPGEKTADPPLQIPGGCAIFSELYQTAIKPFRKWFYSPNVFCIRRSA
jgi:hypothetical protein